MLQNTITIDKILAIIIALQTCAKYKLSTFGEIYDHSAYLQTSGEFTAYNSIYRAIIDDYSEIKYLTDFVNKVKNYTKREMAEINDSNNLTTILSGELAAYETAYNLMTDETFFTKMIEYYEL